MVLPKFSKGLHPNHHRRWRAWKESEGMLEAKGEDGCCPQSMAASGG